MFIQKLTLRIIHISFSKGTLNVKGNSRCQKHYNQDNANIWIWVELSRFVLNKTHELSWAIHGRSNFELSWANHQKRWVFNSLHISITNKCNCWNGWVLISNTFYLKYSSRPISTPTQLYLRDAAYKEERQTYSVCKWGFSELLGHWILSLSCMH